MNRIQYLLDDDVDLPFLTTPPVAELAATPGDCDNPHCVFTPQHYEANYAYPLIVWLHGPADDERQVNRVMPLVSLRNYVAVGPRATCRADEGGFCWSQDAEHITRAEERVLKSISVARRWLNIAPHRIYVAGFACGGTMALRMALNHPRLFAGVLSIGGGLPTTERPFGQFHAVRRSNVFLATGRHSTHYPEDEVCRDLRLLHTASMQVNLRQYPCGDDVTTDMLSDMDRWIMEQVATATPAAVDQPSHRQ